MKNLLSMFLVFCMIFNMAVFAVPALDSAEPAVLAEESAAEKMIPGMNVFTGDTNAITFDTEADLEYVTVGPRWMANAVVDYEINSVSGRGNMLRFKNTNAVTDASEHFVVKLAFKADTVVDRPAYFIARVYDACTYWSGLGGGWMRQNASGNWFGGTISKILGEDNIPNSDTFQVEPWAIYSNDYWMCIDNVAVIPYYKITYKNVDANGNSLGNDIVKYVLETENISVSSSDGIITGLPDKAYVDDTVSITSDTAAFYGWNTEYGASEPISEFTLAGEDVVLYPVWKSTVSVSIPDIISDNLLIQQGKVFTVSGEVSADTVVRAVLKSGDEILSEGEAASENKNFFVDIPAIEQYIDGLTLEIYAAGKLAKTVNNVAVGELWHMSGQSNMEVRMKASDIPEDDYSAIRYYQNGRWMLASSDNIDDMSYVGFNFLKSLYDGFDKNTVVGGIDTAKAGRSISFFVGPCVSSNSGGLQYADKIKEATAIPVKGHIWYQGESDSKNKNYAENLTELISSWRKAWADDFQHFIIVQLPQSAATVVNFDAISGNQTPDVIPTTTYDYTQVRFAQTEVYDKMKNDGVDMVATVDLIEKIENPKTFENKGGEDPLHPNNKAPFGVRLAQKALSRIYGYDSFNSDYPFVKDINVYGNEVFVSFESCGSGLVTEDGKAPRFFEIIGDDGQYYAPEDAEITDKNVVRLICPQNVKVKGVAYFHENHFVDMSDIFTGCDINLMTEEGLPAIPFEVQVDCTPGKNILNGKTTVLGFDDEADISCFEFSSVYDNTSSVTMSVYNSKLKLSYPGKTDASGHFVSKLTAPLGCDINRPLYAAFDINECFTHIYDANGRIYANETQNEKSSHVVIDTGDKAYMSDSISLNIWDLFGSGYSKYIDNFFAVPYYKVTYKNVDAFGNEREDIVKYVLDTENISVNADGSISGLDFMYAPDEILECVNAELIGWSTVKNAEEPDDEIMLCGNDVILYPVWEKGEKTVVPGVNVLTDSVKPVTFDKNSDFDMFSVKSKYDASLVPGIYLNTTGMIYGNRCMGISMPGKTDASGHYMSTLNIDLGVDVDRPVLAVLRMYSCFTRLYAPSGMMLQNDTQTEKTQALVKKYAEEPLNASSLTFDIWDLYGYGAAKCFDDVAVIPYYKVTYKNISHVGKASNDIVKYTLGDISQISVSQSEISGIPLKAEVDSSVITSFGETGFLGWALEENAQEPISEFNLENRDITLYPVWSNEAGDVEEAVLKPGINAFTGNTTAVTFETEADLEYVSLAPVWDKTAVIDYQIGERTAYNGIGKSLMFKNTNGKTDASMHFVSRITATMPITVDRPAFMIARVGDAYTQWRCNGELRTNTDGDWRNAEIKTILDGENILNSDKLKIDALSLDGNSYWMYFDNLAVIPYYQVTYKNILPDGTVGEDVVKYELDTSAISVSTNDGIIAGLPEALVPSEALEADGYTFMGWTTEENGVSAMKTIPLANKDIVLYPVWIEGEYTLPGTNGMWDFEMSLNNGWDAYGTGYEISCEDGVLTVNTAADTIDGTPYISHNQVNLDTSKYRYLVLNVRNRSDADTFSFYYTTSVSPNFSEDKCFTISIEPDKGIFHDIVIDMKQFTNWQGYYQDCMLTLHTGGTGYVDFEEIYFTEDYYGDDGMYHYPLYGSAYTSSYPLVAVSPHKSTFNSYIRTWSTTAANDGYINFPAPTETVNSEDYAYFVIKSLRNEDSYEGQIVYYFTTSEHTSKDEVKTVYASATAGYSGFYNYHIFRLESNSSYTGTLGGGMLKLLENAGDLEIVDMFMCDSTDFLMNENGVEQPVFRIDDTGISENGGSINVKPYFSIPGVGVIDNFDGAKWALDSVCVSPEILDDGTLTLTGKMNGEIDVTVFFEHDDITYSDTAVITVSGQTPKLPATKIKLVTYGNSIMLHGPSESLGWYGNHGMAASSKDKDYVHQLIGNLEEKYGKGNVEHKYGSGQKSFESATSTSTTETDWETYLEGVTEFSRAEQPDIVTVQYGENSTATNSAAYQYALTSFVDAVHKGAPDAVVLITLPWWSYKGLATYTGAENAAKALDVPLADLSALSQNREENWAIGKFDQYAVYSHPGDLGMERIADEMYTKMLPYLTSAIDGNIEYSAEITGVTVTADTNTITTPYGTLALTAKVEPASANQSVSWKSSNENIATVDSNGVVTAINNGNVTITATSSYDSTVSGTIDLEISGQTPCYTLSFDKNTDDAVTNMPESNSYAKGEIALPEIYPERKYFNFVGWALTKDGNVIDVVNVEDDTVLYAVWEKAYRWSFDRDGFAEGFVIKNGFNQKIADGRYQSIATATDEASGNILTVVSPELDIEEGEFDKLVIKMQNTAINNGSSIRLEINADTSYNYVLPVASTEVAEYEFDLSEVKGTVTGFSFKPTNIDATVFLDEIYFVKNIYGKFYLESEMLGISGASSMKINGESTEITEGKAYDVLLDKGLGTVSFNVNGKEKIFRITANENANGFVYTTDDKAFAAFTNGGYDGCTFIVSTYKDRRIADTQILSSDDSLLCDITGMDKAVMFVFEDKKSIKPVCEEITISNTTLEVIK